MASENPTFSSEDSLNPMEKLGLSLAGKVALITGSGRGLGYEVAKAFAVVGAHVILNGRSADLLEEGAGKMRAEGGLVSTMPFDVADERASSAAIRAIGKQFGGLDILVNNAGPRDRRGMFELEPEAMRRMLDSHVVASFVLSREAARLMKEKGEGRIINFTSMVAYRASAIGDTAYVAAKGAVASMTRAMAIELGPYQVTVNGIAPGAFATETNQSFVENPEASAFVTEKIPLRRWGRPEEIAGAALFLASPAAAYVTGQTIVVDGGAMASS